MEAEKKAPCGNCWKLDRTKDWCERYKVVLKFDGVKRLKVYFRCDECVEKAKIVDLTTTN